MEKAGVRNRAERLIDTVPYNVVDQHAQMLPTHDPRLPLWPVVTASQPRDGVPHLLQAGFLRTAAHPALLVSLQ